MRSRLCLLLFAGVACSTEELPDDPPVSDAGTVMTHPDAEVTYPDAAEDQPDAEEMIEDSGMMGFPDATVRPDLGLQDGGDQGEARIPLNDLGNATYKGMYRGGLYGGGSNEMSDAHRAEGILRAQGIEPLDADGLPSAMGKYGLISIGMSNTTQEWCDGDAMPPCLLNTFMRRAADSMDVNHTTLTIVNGAMGFRVASFWDSPMDQDYDRVRDSVLQPAGLTEAQIVAAWVKVANSTPQRALPDPEADALRLLRSMGDILRALKVRYPNLQMAYFSTRIYGGYATVMLNPEPYAYEYGFAVQWLMEAQRAQMESGRIVNEVAGDLDYRTAVPWISWGPYLWADGTNPRSDGLIWEMADMQMDGTHPSRAGQGKVGQMLMDFFSSSPFTKCWFLAAGGECL
jgi:hypothetical protein